MVARARPNWKSGILKNVNTEEERLIVSAHARAPVQTIYFFYIILEIYEIINVISEPMIPPINAEIMVEEVF